MSPPRIEAKEETEVRTTVRGIYLYGALLIVTVTWLTRQDMRTASVEEGTKENSKQLSALTLSVAEQGQRLMVYEVTMKAMNDKLDYLVARPNR